MHNKHERLSEDMRLLVSNIITQELKHPDLEGMLTVTRIEITPDQKYAKIFISMFGAKDKEKVLAALRKSTGYVKKQISLRLKIRNTPALTFVTDDSMEYGAYMNEVFKKMK